MMESEVFFHYLSILPWVGMQHHLLTLTTRTGHRMSNISEILKLALSLLSCSLIDLTLLVEVTCQLGRTSFLCAPARVGGFGFLCWNGLFRNGMGSRLTPVDSP